MRIEVLDHGYVEFVEAWGTGHDGKHSCNDGSGDDYEVGLIEAARQSTQGSFRGWDQDAKLLKYLHDHKHATPFEFAGMVLEVQAPIFVFREHQRHRTQSYNEMSARYTPLPDLYYRPQQVMTQKRIRTAQNATNKQAASVGDITANAATASDTASLWLERLENFYRIAEAHYQNALADGIPKELARIVMPVGHYSRMRASANLRNWLAFLTLRLDPAAQWEIRQYAEAVGRCVAEAFPHTWELFNVSSVR